MWELMNVFWVYYIYMASSDFFICFTVSKYLKYLKYQKYLKYLKYLKYQKSDMDIEYFALSINLMLPEKTKTSNIFSFFF